MIKFGEYEIGREEISIGLIIFFALIMMFFMGYKVAYNQAINYANEQIEEITGKDVLNYNVATDDMPEEYIIKISGVSEDEK